VFGPAWENADEFGQAEVALAGTDAVICTSEKKLELSTSIVARALEQAISPKPHPKARNAARIEEALINIAMASGWRDD
jgi:hypothetical protein